MPRVVPSQVVEFVDKFFPSAARETGARVYSPHTPADAPKLRALVELIRRIPEELLQLEPEELIPYLTAMVTLDEWLQSPADITPWVDTRSPAGALRATLSKCPDEFPAEATSDLRFIIDTELRLVLRNDVSAVERALANGEWKAATVFAGSVIEALLLWAIQDKGEPACQAAAAKAAPKADKNCLRWDLDEYTRVAAELGIIKPVAVAAVDLARGFRNLIHPGRAQRLQQKCDRATALSAVAAMEHVVRDLGR